MREWQDALWARFYTGAPARQRQSVERYNIEESLRVLARRYGINQKTVAKWKKRMAVKDLPTGPKNVHSTVLSIEDEAVIVAFRKHTLLPLDDCLYALQATIPHLTRSSLHRSLQRHGISRLPKVTGDKEPKRKFKTYPIGYFHIDIAEVRTAEGKLYLYPSELGEVIDMLQRARIDLEPMISHRLRGEEVMEVFATAQPPAASRQPPAAAAKVLVQYGAVKTIGRWKHAELGFRKDVARTCCGAREAHLEAPADTSCVVRDDDGLFNTFHLVPDTPHSAGSRRCISRTSEPRDVNERPASPSWRRSAPAEKYRPFDLHNIALNSARNL